VQKEEEEEGGGGGGGEEEEEEEEEEGEEHTELNAVTCCLPLDDHEEGLNVNQWD
jgi:hypothetical protein